MQGDSLIYFLVIVTIALITVASIVISYCRNKDLFSPVKIFVFFNVFYYLDIYINSYDFIVIITYGCQCLILLIMALIEPVLSDEKIYTKKVHLNRKVILSIWGLSVISIINQIVVIIELGGVVNYIGNLAFRVEYFKGRGYIIILNNLISIMNVLYFALLLNSKNASKKNWLFFYFHFLFFVGIALLSGSRSFLLMTILVEIIVFNYVSKKLTVVKIMPFIISIMFMIALLGGVRNAVTTSDGELSVNDDSMKMESTHFKYGLIPLEIIYNSPSRELSYGMTYASLFTNFIPRSIYPDKLDTGGIVFTKRYTGDQWGGLSNLATGTVTEGIINFGFSFGAIIGFLSLVVFYISGLILYSKLPKLLIKEYSFTYVVLYIYIMLAFARISYSEFSYTFFTYAFYYLIPAIILIVLSKIKFLNSNR
ncbi:O-antigen polymerase [Moritella viscosa]|uniref:O-antigen polymerase n=1 Tax=Moritella viscosa TaxID=80854 RepID=UPI000923C802|nr:O-antigen polymerase [Moritella viscosa]SGY94178.1 Putative uncharacterized protein hp3 [Moritella viscosa]